MNATPPTTPPAIAPAGVALLLDVVAVAEGSAVDDVDVDVEDVGWLDVVEEVEVTVGPVSQARIAHSGTQCQNGQSVLSVRLSALPNQGPR